MKYIYSVHFTVFLTAMANSLFNQTLHAKKNRSIIQNVYLLSYYSVA